MDCSRGFPPESSCPSRDDAFAAEERALLHAEPTHGVRFHLTLVEAEYPRRHHRPSLTALQYGTKTRFAHCTLLADLLATQLVECGGESPALTSALGELRTLVVRRDDKALDFVDRRERPLLTALPNEVAGDLLDLAETLRNGVRCGCNGIGSFAVSRDSVEALIRTPSSAC